MNRALMTTFLVAALAIGCGGDGDDANNGNNGSPESCADCVGTNTGPENMPDLAVSCEPSGEMFECTCTTQSGATRSVFLSEAGCQ